MRTEPLGLTTGTIGAQHSVGSVTEDITPISVIRASSCFSLV